MKKKKQLFFHSKCCGSHWELVARNGEFILECEICGKPTNIKFEDKPKNGLDGILYWGDKNEKNRRFKVA